MAFIYQNGKRYEALAFETEDEFEKEVIAHRVQLFGPDTIYIDAKRLIGKRGDWRGGIPDAFLIDLTDPTDPHLYFVENELSKHNVYKHIAEQVARFLASAEVDSVQVRKIITEFIRKDDELHADIAKRIQKTQFHNLDQLMNTLVEKPVRVIVVIDEETEDLNHVLSVFKLKPDTAILRRYVQGKDTIYFCEPMRSELPDLEARNRGASRTLKSEYDTIVCPAYEEGFQTAYQENDAWWSIRMSQEARERVKYLAIYQKNPVAAVEHYAEVDRIEEYKKSGKFIVYLRNKKKLPTPIKLDRDGKRGVAPQGPRFTTLAKMREAKKLSELWK